MGFVVAFATMCLLWLLILRIWFAAADAPPPFHWTWIVGLVDRRGRLPDRSGADARRHRRRLERPSALVWGTIGDVFHRPGRF